jgi:putative hemolysin
MSSDPFETFSYATPGDPPLRRLTIRLIERMTGQPRLKRIYRQYRTESGAGNFWEQAIARLRLTLVFDPKPVAAWPRTGALVIVCNHPFGVIDGLAVCALTARIRPDFRILTNAVLNRAEEIKPHLLPVDFSDTKEALGINLKSRAQARAHLAAGGVLIVFPAGGVSTTPSIWHARAVDAQWKNFTAKLILGAHAPVAPLYFEGQNSRLFQIASHLHQTLRLSLLFKEVHDRIGAEIRVRPGPPIPFSELGHLAPDALMAELRARTYGLASGLAGEGHAV